MKILGLSIANGLVALSGCISCQQQGVFEISSGTGAIVVGLASVIVGTSLYKMLKKNILYQGYDLCIFRCNSL